MKKSIVNKLIAGAIASTMVLGMTACGGSEVENSGSASDSTPVSSSATPGSTGSGSAAPTEAPTPEPTAVPPLSITFSLPSDNEHAEGNPLYDRLVADINEYTNMDVTYQWKNRTAYFEQLELNYVSGDVADITIASRSSAFYKACDEGLFWELTDYIDDYDNLAAIPDIAIDNASRNGKVWSIPSHRTLARNGWGYRLDWLNNLGLKEPTDWESFVDMLYAFTYNDPDGNGVDDTVGLGVDSWMGMWDIMEAWFGVPYVWGVDANGDLIHESQTPEFLAAWKAFRQLYADGLINNGANGIAHYSELNPGAARKSLLQNGQAGVFVQVLGDVRKVQQYFENQGITTTDNIIFTMNNVLDCGYGNRVQTNGGTGNQFAISTKNIKTEEQLRQVLGYLNDLCDGEMLNLIEYGWEGVTYELDENGYIVRYDDAKLTELGVVKNGYSDGFNQGLVYYTAEANARPHVEATNYTPIVQMEKDLNASGEQWLVANVGVSYVSDTYIENGAALDQILTDAQNDYLQGIIDDAGFEAAIKQWWTAGGEQVTKEMNELYHAAGN